MTNIVKPQTLRGFRDFLPEEARKRQYAIDIIRQTFERWGFEPLETPAIEYLEIFTGNIGDDEKLFYKFTDEVNRKVALRYDQTVPTCRVIAQYPDKITLPFKCYQIQTVWRAEKPQRGRYREFLQADADIFGLSNPESDAEVIALSIDCFKKLGFPNPIAKINDRVLYSGVPYTAIVAIDKLEKIGKDGVISELIDRGFAKNEAEAILNQVSNNQPNTNLQQIFKYLDQYGLEKNYEFTPTLARSFSYSTGTIWEIIVPEFTAGSLAGCERFDSLVSRFSNKQVPGVGFSIGFDRTLVAMDELNLFPPTKTKTKVIIAIVGKGNLKYSLELAAQLRSQSINTETYTDPDVALDKQLKYADKKGIPFVAIIGEKEVKDNTVTLKDMATGDQQSLSLDKLLSLLRS